VKKSIILLSAIILSLLFVPAISAKSSDIFINYLTDIIWKDCQGKDIHINQPILKLISTNQTLSLIKWPYSKEDLRSVIQILSEQPYRTYQGQCDGVYSMVSDTGWEGCGILTSGKNKLNINFDTYYWNGVKVDVPVEDIKIASGQNSTIIETHGEMSPVTTGPNSPVTTGNGSSITQQNVTLAFSFGAGTVFGIIAKTLVDYVIRRHSKRSPPKKPPIHGK
jgi:hypothetical protein